MANNNCRPLPCFTDAQAALFWDQVNKKGPDECWEWTGYRFRKGYGVFRTAGPNRATLRCSRISFFLVTGVDPGALMVLHKCDNPPCCNPRHLFLGTIPENTADMVAKGRQSKGDNHPKRLRPELVKRGDDHPRKILTSAQVLAIRSAFSAGASRSSIAEKYKVNYGNVVAIIARRTWRHLPQTTAS